jgi:Fe-S-cluster containining protein
MDLDKYKVEAKKLFSEHQKTIAKLKKVKPKNLDDQFHDLHDEVFEKINCLDCANCCKTTSPIFYEADIDRVSKSLKMKTGIFIMTYLHKDEDNDYILNSSPCPFLGFNNECMVYDSRPRACREYPHTNRKRMHQILNLTLKNTQVCPAVHEIVQGLSTKK